MATPLGKVPTQAEMDAILRGEVMDTDKLTPAYYNNWKISPLEYITANKLDFFRGNILKYVMRYEGKNGKEDLEKAKWYLQYLIDHYEELTNGE